VSTIALERPKEVASKASRGRGGVPARRAMVRWAWRLFRREWRQQVLIVTLITVAVAATIIGAAVAVNTPPPKNAGFGTANHMITIPGPDPHLDAQIAAISAHFGAVDVIKNQSVLTGSTRGAQLRAQDPHGAFGGAMLSVLSGRYPVGAHEVSLTQGVASTYAIGIGDTWRAAGQVRTVVGIVRNPQNYPDEFALVAPGQVRAPTLTTVLFNATPSQLTAAGSFLGSLPSGWTLLVPPGPGNGIPPAFLVLVLDTFGLLFIGLVAVAGFTVMAQRRKRAFGMLGSIGATDRNIRLVMMANGGVIGLVAMVLGAALGLLGWYVYHPHLELSAGHDVALSSVPWWLVGAAMALAFLTAVLAARWPARAIAAMPVVAALSGRPNPPKDKYRSLLFSTVLLAVGFILIAVNAPDSGHGPGSPLGAMAGIVAITIGGLFLAPHAVTQVASLAARAPVAIRLALRDLARYRARSGSALGATSFAIIIAVIICAAATARYADPLDYFAPNLPSNQLVVYLSGGPNTTLSPGPKGGPPPTNATRQVAQLRRNVEAALGTRDTLTLEMTGASIAHIGPGKNFSGNVYVETPQLLAFYGIAPSSIDPTADVLTARPGLSGVSNLGLVYGDYYGQNGNGPTGPSPCPPTTCLANPVIQEVAQLPTYLSAPNTVVSEHAARTLHLRSSLSGWLFQTPKALTSVQINTARQLALAAGASVESKNGSPSLQELDGLATLAGLLLALGVLAMTIGLMRSETVGDMRILAATGASRSTRRQVSAATAATLGLLGALLGTAIAYFTMIAFFISDLGDNLGHVPWRYLGILIIGLPLLAAAGGWLFAGREPRAIARRPLE
jgi:putative ABC transport system permease protein